MRRILTVSLLLLLIACRKEELTPTTDGVQGPVLQERSDPSPVPDGAALTQEALDHLVIGTLEQRNDFHWEWMDLRTLWSAVQYNDHSLAIGYAPANMGDISDIINTIDIKKPEWRAVHDALIDLVLTQLNSDGRSAITLRDILVEDDPVLPILTLRITDKNVITRLHNLRNVRYLEPLDYWPATADDERSTS